MPYIKRFENINESSSNGWVDNQSIRLVVEAMKPNNSDPGYFKIALKSFNSQYKTREKEEKITESLNTVNWADMNLIQEVLYRMDPKMCDKSEQYKNELRSFLREIFEKG